MTPEIRRAALRAAAKAALVFTVGCSGSSKSAPPPENTASSASAVTATPMSCPDHLASLAKGSKDSLAADDPVRARNDVYGDVFTDRGARESARTQECCTEELTKAGSMAALRWECCSALPADNAKLGSACTPWGPPCPPEMA